MTSPGGLAERNVTRYRLGLVATLASGLRLITNLSSRCERTTTAMSRPNAFLSRPRTRCSMRSDDSLLERTTLPLVIQSPRGVPHQTHRPVPLPPGQRSPRLDCPPQRLRGRARELRVRAPHRVQDVRVGAAQL